jgi:hypothetical protein
LRQSTPSVPEDVEGPGLPPSLPLVLFTYLAESAWIFTVFGFIAAALAPAAAFSPAFVFAPYGLGILVTLFLVALWGAVWSFSRRFEGKALRLGRALALEAPHLLLLLAGVAVGAIYVAAFVAAMLAVNWWELYRGANLMDPSWLALPLADIDDGTERAAALAWLWVLGVIIWWRGSYVARARVDSASVASRFTAGLLSLVALTVWASIDSVGGIDASSLLAAYLLFGLAAVATTRLEATMEGRAGTMDFRWRWQSLALSFLLVLLSFGLVLVGLPLLAQLASWIWDWIVYGLVPALMELLAWISRLLGLDSPPDALPMPPEEKVPAPPQAAERPYSFPEWLAEFARLMFALSWGAMILYAIYVNIRHRFSWWGRRRAGEPIRERIPWSLRSWLISLLLPLLRLLASRWPALTSWVSRLAAREEMGWTVRRIYRRLLAWGASHGSAREPCATPTEYELLLSARWPALREDFHAITASYLEARYGGVAASEEELEAVLRGWLRVESAGRRGEEQRM